MATQKPGFAVPLAEFAAGLLSEREVTPRARLTAHQVVEMLPGAAVVVYVVENQEAPAWSAKAAEGEIQVAESVVVFDAGTLGTIAETKAAHIFPGGELAREQYSHLNLRRTIASLAYVPILLEGTLLGALEIIHYDQPVTESELAPVEELAEYVALGLTTALAYENERNTHLESITRIAQMYDLEKVFNGTLEMDQLLEIITSKFREVTGVQAVSLWLVEGDDLVLMSCSGVDPAFEVGARQKAGEGIVAQVSDNGEAVLIESAEDERLQRRNRGVEEGQAFSLLAAPVIHGGALVGVVEAINKLDGTPFDDDDQFLLTTINETASNALHNASLLLAERKVEILELLVRVSQEITSTLNLERVLHTIVNGSQAVIPFERAAIALEQHGKLRLCAVSGMTEESIDLSLPHVAALNEMLKWVSSSSEEIYVRQVEEEIDDPREENRAKFAQYFSQTGARAFYAVHLADDSGRVGILSFESSNPDFLSEAHQELVRVLAGQATVALRNAQMYKEVPFIGLLEPVLARKRRFLSLEKGRQKAVLALAGAALAFLVVVPWPMRVDGKAVVAPGHRANVQPEVEGVVRRVYVREGDAVKRGIILADLEDWEYSSAYAAAQARYGTAMAEMNRSLAANDGAAAGQQRVEAEFWAAEVQRARQRLDHTHLRTPIDGILATPHVENFVGRHLNPGDSFAEVVDSSRATVDVAIDERDAGLLEAGTSASIKLDSFPTTTFRGQVVVVSPKGDSTEDGRMFYARVDLPNPQGVIRPGMEGRGKVWVGWRQTGYVFFRRPAMWVWSKLWSWMGW